MSESNRIETTRGNLRKEAFVLATALAAALLCAPSARAQDDQSSAPLAQSTSSCETDVRTMQERRSKLIDEFNAMAKSHGGKLDPIESCPKLKTLSALENTFKLYMVKNKDWCNIPDAAIANVTDSQSKTSALATRVCNVALQVKKQQEQQAAGGGVGAPPAVRLPAGPL